MPLGFNFVSFISSGVEHEIMIYSFVFVYIFVIALIESSKVSSTKKNNSNLVFHKFVSRFYAILMAVLLFNFVIFSNQCYLCKQLQSNSTNLIMNRIIYELEKTDDYVAGQTPIAIIGDIGYNNKLTT